MRQDPGSRAGPSVATGALGARERPRRCRSGPAPRDAVGFQNGRQEARALPGAAEDCEGVRPRHPRLLWRFVPGATAHARSGLAPFWALRRAEHGPGAAGPLRVLWVLLVAPSTSRPTRPVRLSTAARPKSLRRFRGPGANGSVKPRAGPCVTAPVTRPGPRVPLSRALNPYT